MAVNVKVLRLTKIYETSGTKEEVMRDFAAIHTADRRAERLSKRAWLGLLLIPLFVVLAVQVNDDEASPILMGMALLSLIVTLVVRVSVGRLDLENRRYELANGLIHALEIAPGTRLRVGIDFHPATYQKFMVNEYRAGNVTHSYFSQPWLYIEATLADGLGFGFARTTRTHCESSLEYRMGKRVHKFRESSSFHDELTLHTGPGRFPHVEAMGHSIAADLSIQGVAICERVVNANGILSALVSCPYKWDAGPVGSKGFNAVVMTASFVEIFYRLLGTRPMVDMMRAQYARAR